MDGFVYELNDSVRLRTSNETGTVVGRAEYSDGCPEYLVLYQAGDGRQVKTWWNATDLVAA